MPDANIEHKLGLAYTELNNHIARLHEVLLETARTGEALQDSEKRYRRLFESARDGILILDYETGKVVDVNPFLVQLLGYPYETFCGKCIWELGAFKDIAASKDAYKTLQDNEYIRYEDLPLQTIDGQPIAVEFVSNVYLVDNIKVIQCNIRDITAHKLAKAERIRLMAAIEQVDVGIVVTDAQGGIQFVNPAFERITGYPGKDVIGQNPRILKSGMQDEFFYRNLWETISGGKTWTGQMDNKRKDGTIYTEETTISPVYDDSGRIVNYVAVQRDITEHLKLTTRFYQAKRMEAVGLLAGGVAHDFNNMLTVILGYAEIALNKVAPSQALYSDLEEIIKVVKRSTGLTRQLLSFARKETIVPVVLDLNQVVDNMLNMLRQLIGEKIRLVWFPDHGLFPSAINQGLCPIKMDLGQIEQILINICINSRDAIPDIGKITIETRDTVLAETSCDDIAGAVAGQEYVLLVVSDDGCGMDSETTDKIFEPFYTSKEAGQGIGLGLSTVYGIVKQNNGFINVKSEPGKGTTFEIYLPRYAVKAVDAPQEKVASEIPMGCGETLLLVEDEPAILNMVQKMLERFGYRVLAAATPGEALALAEKYGSEINLLVTDIVMPEMNGRELAELMQSRYPGMKILFMSGYTANIIANRDMEGESVNFLSKPFSMHDMGIKVAEVLSATRKTSDTAALTQRENMEIYHND